MGGAGGPDVFQVVSIGDGTLYLGRQLIDPSSGLVTQIAGSFSIFQGVGTNSVWAPGGQPQLVVTHHSAVQTFKPDGGLLANLSGIPPDAEVRPVAIQVDGGIGFLNGVVFALGDGGTLGTLASCSGCGSGALAIDSSSIYSVTRGYIARFGRATLANVWLKTLVVAARLGPPALSASGDVFSLGEDGTIYGYHPNGTPVWTSFPSVAAIPYQPTCCSSGPLRFVVITADGLLLANASDNKVHALSLATGLEVWSSGDLRGVPQQMLVADNGIIYVQVPTVGSVFGLNASTGEVRYEFQNVPANAQPEYNSMLIRQGTMYVSGNLNLMGFGVPSTGLDPASPWPKVFHDSQNTCHQQSNVSF